jgi:anti-sigma factor RsiW
MSHRHEDLSCEEVVELVTAYLDGALDDTDRTRFETHVVFCEGCDRYLDQMRGTIATVGELASENVAPEAMDDLLDAFRGWKQRSLEE